MINRNAGRNLWRNNVWLLGLITAFAFGVSVYAQDRDDYGERWVYLGSRRVDGHRDHDVIRVGMRDGKFRAVQLRVSGGAVDFHRVIVHFGNDTSEEIAFRERIPDGEFGHQWDAHRHHCRAHGQGPTNDPALSDAA